MRWRGCMEGMRNALLGKLEGKIIFWKPRHRWKDNIKSNLKGIHCADMDMFDLAYGRVH
jgi:hypothetical protein